MERIIEPEQYTPEIQQAIALVKYRMQATLIEYAEDDILVVEHEGTTYILANPILGVEPVYSELGELIELAPLRNITFRSDADWLKVTATYIALKFTCKLPKVRIMRPDLCIRL